MASDARIIQLGSAFLEPGTLRLRQGDREVRLDSKELAVLLELAASAPDVVPRERLLACAWARTTVVDNSLDQVIARLRRAFGDDARHPRCIETLPGRGYRLMVPVVPADAGRGAETREESGLPTLSFLPLATVGDELTLADYARMASEEIVNRLAQSRAARVISLSTTEDTRRTAKFIGQGTLRRLGDKIRVSIQLLRTDSGELLCSESFDEPVESLTTRRFARAPFVARMIEALVRSAHRADRLRTSSERARRHFFLGLREVDAFGYGAGDTVVAANHFERALAHDPELKHALEQLVYAYGTRLDEQIRGDEALARAHLVLPRLLEVDPNATLSLSFVNQHLDLDYASALANIEHARRHRFADVPTVEFYKGLLLLKQARFEEAIDRMKASIGAGLGPREAHAHYFLADAHWALGRFDDALACVDRALQSASPDWFRGRMMRIRIGHFKGDIDEAKRDLDSLWSAFGETHRASFPSVFASLGQPELARAILRENDAAWREHRLHLCSYSFGGHYHLGELDHAFDWLDRAVENREWWMLPLLRSEVFYQDIRSDSRFERAMRRMAEIEATGSPTKSVATGL